MRRRILLPIILIIAAFLSLAEAAPSRIVSLAPSITENLFALGVGDNVVGVTSFCDYPAAAAEKTVIGDATSLNLELLLALEPDLIVGDSTLVQGHLNQLADLGLPTFAVGPTSLKEIRESLIELGEAVGRREEGERLAAEMAARQQAITEKIDRDFKPKVFVEIWHEPLMTAGPGSFMDELIVLAGGENIAADANDPWPLYSEEMVIEKNPQVLILTGFNRAEVLKRPAWQEIDAVKRGLVFEVDPDLYARSTARLLDALAEMSEILDKAAQ